MTKTKAKPAPKIKSARLGPWIVFLLDRSGSMEASAEETVKGFNAYIDSAKKNPDLKSAIISFEQFDSQSLDVIHDRVAIGDVPKLKVFEPRAMTPLYDAMGWLIEKVSRLWKQKDNLDVLFITLTDGIENASREFTLQALKDLIKKQESLGWTFSYIGVGLDAARQVQNIASGTIGAANVKQSSYKNTGVLYRAMAQATGSYSHQIKSAGGQSVRGFWNKTQDTDDES